MHHDFVAAVDTFNLSGTLPTVAQLTPGPANPGAASYDNAFRHMKAFWNQRLSAVTDAFAAECVAAPHERPASPGTAIDNAYKAAFVYTRIVQAEKSPFSGANNYDWLLNHDLPGILANRFELGDFTDAQSLLLARVSEEPNFNEQGATGIGTASGGRRSRGPHYLEGTNDVAFVSRTSTTTPTGPVSGGRACTR